MTTLNWLEVDEIHLHDAIIQKPGNLSQVTDQLNSVRVAIDGAFLHIDPRPTNDPQQPGAAGLDFPVHVVPASSVAVIRYRTGAGSPRFRQV